MPSELHHEADLLSIKLKFRYLLAFRLCLWYNDNTGTGAIT